MAKEKKEKMNDQVRVTSLTHLKDAMKEKDRRNSPFHEHDLVVIEGVDKKSPSLGRVAIITRIEGRCAFVGWIDEQGRGVQRKIGLDKLRPLSQELWAIWRERNIHVVHMEGA